MDKNKINKLLGAALLLLLGVFVAALLLQLSSLLYTPSKTACTKKVCLKKFLDGPPAFNDEYMARFLRSKFITAPAPGPLNLSSSNNRDKDAAYDSAISFLNDHFKDTRNGRFLVLGAGDGEYRDLTLDLESKFGWSGLLVEPHPQLHEMLVAKNRNAELSSACISPFTYPSQAKFAYPAFEQSISEHDKMMRYRETRLSQLWTEHYKMETFTTQCIPVANIIYASDTITDKIDLMVMDMSGTDLDIMMSTNLDWLPEVEMVVVVAHGTDIASEIGGYFLEKNMVVSKVFGSEARYARFIITKFESENSLVD